MIYVTAGCLGWIWWWNPSTIQRHCSCTKKPMVFRSLNLETQWYQEFFVFLRIVEFDKVKISKGARNHCRFAGFCWCQQMSENDSPFLLKLSFAAVCIDETGLNTSLKKYQKKHENQAKFFSTDQSLSSSTSASSTPLQPPIHLNIFHPRGCCSSVADDLGCLHRSHCVALPKTCPVDTLEEKINGKISSKIPPKMLWEMLSNPQRFHG